MSYLDLDRVSTFNIANSCSSLLTNVNAGELCYKFIKKFNKDQNPKAKEWKKELENLLNYIAKDLKIPPFKVETFDPEKDWDFARNLEKAVKKNKNKIAVVLWDELLMQKEYEATRFTHLMYDTSDTFVYLMLQELFIRVIFSFKFYESKKAHDRTGVVNYCRALEGNSNIYVDAIETARTMQEFCTNSTKHFLKYNNYYNKKKLKL